MAQYYRKLSKGIRWYYKFSFNGKTYFSPCIYQSKAEAKRVEADKYKELDERRRFPDLKDDKKLSELVAYRFEEIKTKRSKKYYKANKQYLNELLDFLGDVWFSDITRGDINNLLTTTAKDLQLRGKGNYTINSMLRIYKAFFNSCILNFNLNNQNPCIGIKLLSIDKRLKYIPSDQDISVLKLKCNQEQCFLIDFVAQTGARINEALRFTGNDILENQIVLYTRKSKNSNLTPRKIPLPGCLIGKSFDKDKKIFDRWSDVPKFLDKKLRQLKEENTSVKIWGWHNLRHRYASLLSKKGTPIFEMMSLLGHSNMETTQGYLQLLA
ncbi:MAG: tyrosine-type recombinase/integrase [Ignavibacteriaceae bacterium]